MSSVAPSLTCSSRLMSCRGSTGYRSESAEHRGEVLHKLVLRLQQIEVQSIKLL